MPRRKDGVFAQVSCRILHGQRINTLSDADWCRYMKLWILAVRERTAIFHADQYGILYLAYELHCGAKSLCNSLNRISQTRLIDYLPDGTVIIEGVMDIHKKFTFEQVHQTSPSCTKPVPQVVQNRGERLEIRDPESGGSSISTDPDSENETQLLAQAPTQAPAGAVVKKGPPPIPKPNPKPEPAEPSPLSPFEREVQAWFLELWPYGEYDWTTERDSLLAQVRRHGRGAYNVARSILLEHRREGKPFHSNELAFLNGIAREQAKP